MATDTNAALIQTEVPPHEPHLLGLDAEGWVYVSLTIFFLIAIFYAKAHRTIAGKLDDRIAETRRSLDEARTLRLDAEALLADVKRKQAETHRDAQSILDHAKIEAGQMIDKARADVDTLIERRGRMAEDKIAAAERSAVADVRATAAGAAAAAAATILAERHGAIADGVLIDRTIASLG